MTNVNVDVLAQLNRFINEDNSNVAWGKPFTLKLDATTWSVATDSYILFAIKVEGPPLLENKKIVSYLKELIEKKAEGYKDINVASLKKWAGRAPSELIQGDVADKYKGVLLAQPIDKRKLAYLLATVKLHKVRAWVLEPKMLAFEPPIDKPAWRAILMGLSDGLGADGLFPIKSVYQIEEAPLSAFELAEMVSD